MVAHVGRGEHRPGAVTAQKPDHEQQHRQRDDGERQPAAETGQFAGQRGGRDAGGAHQPVDHPEFGVRSDRHDDRGAFTTRHDRARVDTVPPVGEHGFHR